MTYKEIQIVSWTCLIFGWVFLALTRQPDLALIFLFAAFGGFVWGGIKKRMGLV